jgi:hypothetical protein
VVTAVAGPTELPLGTWTEQSYLLTCEFRLARSNFGPTVPVLDLPRRRPVSPHDDPWVGPRQSDRCT